MSGGLTISRHAIDPVADPKLIKTLNANISKLLVINTGLSANPPGRVIENSQTAGKVALEKVVWLSSSQFGGNQDALHQIIRR